MEPRAGHRESRAVMVETPKKEEKQSAKCRRETWGTKTRSLKAARRRRKVKDTELGVGVSVGL